MKKVKIYVTAFGERFDMELGVQKVQCPICEQYADAESLDNIGMTKELSVKVRQYIKDGTLGQMLIIAEVVNQRLDPSTTSLELSVSQALEKYGSMIAQKIEQNSMILSGISEKIVGPGIGEISEIIAAQEFVQTFPKDEFDTSQAVKHGADIIASVYDKKVVAGKISISIKDTKSWSNEFIEQLKKNMSHDVATVGMLVSKTLPRRANPKGEVIQNNGHLYFLVAPQYAVAVYAALRQVVINLYNSQQYVQSKEKEMMQIGKISKALAKWISGSEYSAIVETLDKIKTNSEKSCEELISLQEHIDRKVKGIFDKQTSTHREVLNAESFLSGLRELLQQPGD